jgi:hypothetical protein
MRFLKNFSLNIVIEEDAIDYIAESWLTDEINMDAFFSQLTSSFQHGLKLVQEKIGRNRFFITLEALNNPDDYIRQLLVNTAIPSSTPKPPPESERDSK